MFRSVLSDSNLSLKYHTNFPYWRRTYFHLEKICKIASSSIVYWPSAEKITLPGPGETNFCNFCGSLCANLYEQWYLHILRLHCLLYRLCARRFTERAACLECSLANGGAGLASRKAALPLVMVHAGWKAVSLTGSNCSAVCLDLPETDQKCISSGWPMHYLQTPSIFIIDQLSLPLQNWRSLWVVSSACLIVWDSFRMSRITEYVQLAIFPLTDI